jgi:hypothetical protein
MTLRERRLRRLPTTTAGSWQVKRYELTEDGAELSPRVRAGADTALEKLLAHRAPTDGTPAAGFSCLHLSGDVLWLTVFTWSRREILSGVTASAVREPAGGFGELAESGEPFVGGVAELAVVAHERSAWVRHVLEPDAPDERGYVADLLAEGPVGSA